MALVKSGARPDPVAAGNKRLPLVAAQTNRARQALVTRQRIIDATLASIAEVGYYRTTTNQIARRAGVTWGVIQHHFGSRESLLVAVVEADAEDMSRLFADAEIVGETLAERVDSWASLALEYFGRVKYISILQILFDLGNDPEATDATRATLAKHARELDKRMNHAVSRISPAKPLSTELFGFLYQASMGLGTTHGFNTLTHNPKTDQIFAIARRHFVAAVVQYLGTADPNRRPPR